MGGCVKEGDGTCDLVSGGLQGQVGGMGQMTRAEQWGPGTLWPRHAARSSETFSSAEGQDGGGPPRGGCWNMPAPSPESSNREEVWRQGVGAGRPAQGGSRLPWPVCGRPGQGREGRPFFSG